ncbi:MAG TPA: 6-pyruvoyl-tetrahydropterin synthase-related protein [Caldilinea sp.]|nr:6-pyruvoyl-tetrahydropterin synthase-related protein [Caldilinea sp.]
MDDVYTPSSLRHSTVLRYLWLPLLPLLALPALAPLVTEGLPRSYDGAYHLLRLAVLDRAVAGGAFLPRWAPEMLLGFGYPAFNFYGPGSYYLAEVLHWVGLSLAQAFMFAFVVAVIAAGYGAYLLAFDIFGVSAPWPALVAAVAYVYAPYVMDNVYIRGGLAETMALATLPWILFGFRRLFYADAKQPYFFVAAFALALLAITHNITLLFTPPLLVGYLLVLWQRTGRKRADLTWPLLAIAAAMGVSAFFWLPLIVERSYLSAQAYTIAREVWLPISVWTWQNFLDTGFNFTHTFTRPNKLGLVQLVLAAGGFLAARRRDGEWLYLGAVALLGGALIGAWSLPLWQSNDLLAIVQFPWRLLSVISLPLAIFSGGWLLHLPGGWRQFALAVALIALIVVAQRPRLTWIDVFAPRDPDLSPAVLAQVEIEKGVLEGGEGNSSIQEFRPRWADATLALQAQAAGVVPSPAVQVSRANALDLDLTAQVAVTSPLRFTDFYFPGWEVTIDGAPAALYPSTSLGVLTVDLPPGDHVVHKRWTHTPVQTAATWLSLLTLAVLAGVAWRDRRTRWIAVLPAIFWAAGLLGWLTPRDLDAVQLPASPVQRNGVQLLGFQVDTADANHPTIHTFWSVATPPGDLRIRWQVLDQQGELVGAATTRPVYNAGSTELWPVGAVVDDATIAPVPAGLPAGDYRLAVTLLAAEADQTAQREPPTVVGTFTLDAAPVDPEPATQTDARFGAAIHLDGYDYDVARSKPEAGVSVPRVDAGDSLWVTLYWSTQAVLAENYHAFVHLVDATGQPIAQEDHVPGPVFQPPASWTPGRRYTDAYLLRIPPDAEGGVYWPEVGMYAYADQERLPVFAGGADASAEEPDDHMRLPPVKVVAAPRNATFQHPLSARFDDAFELLGFDISAHGMIVRPGDAVTLTLYYRGLAPTDADLTRFVHLYSPQAGMAAQHDGPPANGVNPTWSWMPGEVIRDEVTLVVAQDATPGKAQLSLGFYDAAAGATRAPAFDAAGAPFPDALVPLAEVLIEP